MESIARISLNGPEIPCGLCFKSQKVCKTNFFVGHSGHGFHRICIEAWLLKSHKNECPTCRKKIKLPDTFVIGESRRLNIIDHKTRDLFLNMMMLGSTFFLLIHHADAHEVLSRPAVIGGAVLGIAAGTRLARLAEPLIVNQALVAIHNLPENMRHLAFVAATMEHSMIFIMIKLIEGYALPEAFMNVIRVMYSIYATAVLVATEADIIEGSPRVSSRIIESYGVGLIAGQTIFTVLYAGVAVEAVGNFSEEYIPDYSIAILGGVIVGTTMKVINAVNRKLFNRNFYRAY